MHPELIELPGGLGVKSYGLCLAIAFLGGTILARRRAIRANADPSVIFTVAALAVVFGVGGARLFYVLHYWAFFAAKANPVLAILDFRKGGLEFLGGFLGGLGAIIVYLWIPRAPQRKGGRPTRLPVRLYLDILAPSLMFGLAITRMGCFLNGCCFGNICVEPETQQASYAWAMRFPYGSPPFVRQWERRQLQVPSEFVFNSRDRSYLLPRTTLSSSGAKAGAQDSRKASGKTNAANKNLPRYLSQKLQLTSRDDPSRSTSLRELRELASSLTSLPIHPTQLFAMVNAALLWALLSALVRVRRRHGIVLATLLVLYPVSRFLLEMIRADNPHDTLGMTISQFFSAAMFLSGLVTLFLLYEYFPERSPNAEPTRGFANRSGYDRTRDHTAKQSPKRQREVAKSSLAAEPSKRKRSRKKGPSRRRSS